MFPSLTFYVIFSRLRYFAEKDYSFMMECCERTVNDKKGGHLCVRNGQNVLREAAQCASEDEDAFQDINKHRFFNTNNLWVRLDRLKEEMAKNKGFIPLPMIKNKKTIDPKDDSSLPVRGRQQRYLSCWCQAPNILR